MLSKLVKAIRKPTKLLRYSKAALNARMGKKKDVLVIVGLDPQGELGIIHAGYKRCYCFEANPDRYKKLKNKYSSYPNVNIYNAAAAEKDGEILFNLSSNSGGASSSAGNFNEEWKRTQPEKDIRMIRTITVPSINLYNFCLENNIRFIDDYISDIQGMDLLVLKTLKPMIDKKQIGSIRCEVTKNEYGNIYYDLPDNSFDSFQKLLSDNYKLTAAGSGILRDGLFEKVPSETWEMDCKWQLK